MTRVSLSPHFFEKIPPSSELWKKWQSKTEWSEHLVPLYEWEKILFIGLSPSAAAPLLEDPNFHFVYVEAPAEQLENYYKRLKSSLQVSKIPSSSEFSFDQLDMDSPTPQSAKPDADLDLMQAMEASEEAAPSLGETQTQAIEELELELPAAPTVAFPTPVNSAKPELTNEDETKDIFLQMQRHFSKSMLLRKEGNALIPWKWDQNFTCSQSPPSPLTLGVPSPFRIVTRTQKSFHGALVPGEVQELFFKEWTQGEPVEHMTLIPLFGKDEIIGVLLGIANHSINSKTSLALAEKIGEDLAIKLQSTTEAQAS